ncbi:thiamine pyrophosphate-binding protein [Streptomyces sp. NPDC050448]|uniref:thiamine pyrophosphate-binding protein n=1 Tax=Streptomyces sp. NPDC050448 TaxID=3155404 RepID=UPI003429B873
MAKQNVAEQFVDILVRAGVRRMYGVVGDSLNPVVDAIRRTDGIEWIQVRHEETAAFAAGAEAQITGRLAACAGSCGPGNLHLINGLYDAHRSMAPVLALASHIPSGEIGLGYFQETHPDRLFTECSHYSELISNPRQMPRVLQSAIQHAIGRSGVGVISLPGDIASLPAPEKSIEHALVTARPTVRPGDGEIEKLVRLIDEADRITLFCGSGTAGAHPEVMEFAGRVKAPVGHALRGKEWIQYDNPYTGYLRMYADSHDHAGTWGTAPQSGDRQLNLV